MLIYLKESCYSQLFSLKKWLKKGVTKIIKGKPEKADLKRNAKINAKRNAIKNGMERVNEDEISDEFNE